MKKTIIWIIVAIVLVAAIALGLVWYFVWNDSDCHKAGVIGDTVGDPFKDTSGPSLNILIKLCSTVSIVFSAVIANVHLF